MRLILARLMLAAMIAIPVITLTVVLYPPALAYGLILVGRGPDCPLRSAFQGYHRRLTQNVIEERMVNVCPIMEKRGGFQLARTPVGDFWEPEIRGSVVAAQLAEIEAKYFHAGELDVQPGNIVLDCGANVGTFTRHALRRGAAKVISIEPSAANLECLKRNFQPEIAQGRVVVYPKGVWNREDTAILYENEITTAMDSVVAARGGTSGQRISLTTIDALVAELKLLRVDFIKMDIEGAERQALDGARNSIALWKPVLEISVNHLPDDPVIVPATIASIRRDYNRFCLVCEPNRRRGRTEASILLFR